MTLLCIDLCQRLCIFITYVFLIIIVFVIYVYFIACKNKIITCNISICLIWTNKIELKKYMYPAVRGCCRLKAVDKSQGNTHQESDHHDAHHDGDKTRYGDMDPLAGREPPLIQHHLRIHLINVKLW